MSFSRPYKIIVIDDDRDMLALVSNYLSTVSEDDITVTCFTDPDEAMSFISRSQVHIVITDIHLDFSSGADVITECLELQRGIQLICFSADMTLMTAIDCFNRGAKYLIAKPIDKDELIEVVAKSISFLNDWHEILSNRMSHHDFEKKAS